MQRERSELVLAIDAGTGGGRAAVYDMAGVERASAERRWCATMPEELAPFGREYDPREIRDALDGAVRDVLAAVDKSAVCGIAVTGQRIACAFLDDAGETLYLGPNADVRALAGAQLGDLDADVLYEVTGRFPPWIHAPARLRFFEAVEPAMYARIATVVSFPGWYAHRLSGETAIDETLAADLMMWDVAARAPRVPVPTIAWPQVRPASDVLGVVRASLADEWGLPRRCVVAVGAADTQLALVGAGCVDRASDVLVAGSSAPLLRMVERPVRDPARRLWLDPHLDGAWLLEANLGEMGTLHRWLRECFAFRSFEELDRLASGAPLGCRGASSHLGPRAMDLRALNTARPAAILMPFGETTATGAPGRGELARAFFESCAYAARSGRAWLAAAAPGGRRTLRVVGGMSRSSFFGQTLASVLGDEVIRGPVDATARGAAMCASVAAGLAADLEEAGRAYARGGEPHTPEEDDAEGYEDAYDRWVEREEQLEEM